MMTLEWSSRDIHGNRQHFRRVLRALRLRLVFAQVAETVSAKYRPQSVPSLTNPNYPPIFSIAIVNTSISSSVE